MLDLVIYFDQAANRWMAVLLNANLSWEFPNDSAVLAFSNAMIADDAFGAAACLFPGATDEVLDGVAMDIFNADRLLVGNDIAEATVVFVGDLVTSLEEAGQALWEYLILVIVDV